MSRDELSAATISTYKTKPKATNALYTNMLWAFYHEIAPGDFIIARRGRKTLAGVGKVSRPAIYTPGKASNPKHPHLLEVLWQDQPREKNFSDLVFPMHTLSEISEEQFRKLLEGSGAQPVSLENPETLEDPNAFVLEKYLEDFIVSNFRSIFKGELKVYEDSDGNNGQQYTTDIGSIDILAVEPKTNKFVVIELKKGRPSDQVIGQILRYMGWVKQNLCTSGQGIKGLIICREPDPRLSYALEMTNKIDVRYYSVSFRLRETP